MSEWIGVLCAGGALWAWLLWQRKQQRYADVSRSEAYRRIWRAEIEK